MNALTLAQRAARGLARLRGVTERSVPTSQGALHLYEVPGRGALPTTVILHGLATSATAFLPLAEALRPSVRGVLAPDAPGHGYSEEPPAPLTPDGLFAAMSEALDASLTEPAVVYGASLGGAVALKYALSRPERVRAVVLGSPAGARLPPEAWDALRARFELRTNEEARAFLALLFHRPKWFTPLLAPGLRELFQREAVRSLLTASTADDLFTPEALGGLRVPLLLLWGRSERLLPYACLEYFRAHLPRHARIEEPYGFGHSPHVDDPRRLASLILDFARER